MYGVRRIVHIHNHNEHYLFALNPGVINYLFGYLHFITYAHTYKHTYDTNALIQVAE